MRYLLLALLVTAFSLASMAGSTESKRVKGVDEQIHKAAIDINSIMATPDKAIPRDLLNEALCVGIIPSELKFAFLFGAMAGA